MNLSKIITIGIWISVAAFASSAIGHAEEKKQAGEEYYVWLAPSGAEYEKLHALVCDLAKKYQSPCFLPHMTVVGPVQGSLAEVTRQTKKLADQTQSLQAQLSVIEWTIPDDLYRSFIVLIEPTNALQRLYQATANVFGKNNKPPYHISLMYTKLPLAEREKIRDEIYRGKKATDFNETILLDRLQICFTTNLPPSEWKCPAEIPLKIQ